MKFGDTPEDTPIDTLVQLFVGLPIFGTMIVGAGIMTLDALIWHLERDYLGEAIFGLGVVAGCSIATVVVAIVWLVTCAELLRRAFRRRKAP